MDAIKTNVLVGQIGFVLIVTGIMIDVIATIITIKPKWKKVGEGDLAKEVMREQIDENVWIEKTNKEINKKWMLFGIIMFGVILTLAGIGLQQMEFTGIVEQILIEPKE